MTVMHKKCFKCNGLKPLSSFYAHSQMREGYLNKCKACACADAFLHRRKNIEGIRAYDRKRGSRQTFHWQKEYRARNPEKIRAHGAIQRAIKTGRLTRKPCEECGDKEAVAHHPDYSKPLLINWLCSAHHSQLHAKQKKEMTLE